MKKTLPIVLENCLEAREQGASLDQVLVVHPQWADDLRPLLLTAQMAQTCCEADVAPEMLAKNKRLLLAKAAGLLNVQQKWWNRPLLKTALLACFLLVFLAGGVGGVVAASRSSLPGDPLYGLKRGMEAVQLKIISDPGQKAGMEEELNLRRVKETDRLLQENRQELVRFQGILEQGTDGGWLVSGIPVEITDNTEVDGDLISGSMADVVGSTREGGTVVADKMVITPGKDTDDREDEVEIESTDSPEDGPEVQKDDEDSTDTVTSQEESTGDESEDPDISEDETPTPSGDEKADPEVEEDD